ncbi:hypothetical protein SAMN02745164_00260 [Marinitoga hydrogenitolerans DSM 16785]|uniref:Uncharacterized protein n=1 Tax=Marinitoga hydrogenitolerans (strain DSM 16785 / JCM 12826 / AT1271) TaxID=1122195 RepID=A0A1M4SQ32_MARH1|nr:hypothetical protein [Marinitoga hydrogenitolerans]SHE34301.1 hypothetical protein SAMN02745164_00260 [Marinitoga hydrogenitolerans DSM 16785]
MKKKFIFFMLIVLFNVFIFGSNISVSIETISLINGIPNARIEIKEPGSSNGFEIRSSVLFTSISAYDMMIVGFGGGPKLYFDNSSLYGFVDIGVAVISVSSYADSATAIGYGLSGGFGYKYIFKDSENKIFIEPLLGYGYFNFADYLSYTAPIIGLKIGFSVGK